MQPVIDRELDTIRYHETAMHDWLGKIITRKSEDEMFNQVLAGKYYFSVELLGVFRRWYNEYKMKISKLATA